MKYIKSFLEAKKAKKEKVEDQEIGFTAKSIETDEEIPGFKSEMEVIKDSDVNKIKKTIVEPKITQPKKGGK